MNELSRRRLLTAFGATGAAAVLGSCSRPRSEPSGPTSTPATHPSTVGTAPSAPGVVAWSRLAGALTGPLLRPGSPGYAAAAPLYNPRFDTSSHPAAIAQCAGVADVATCVRFAAQSQLPFAVRSGGHSYGGWSTSPGLVIDVRNLASVHTDGASGTARIGAGAHLVQVYAALGGAGVGIAAGSCPSVGIAGLTLGGGVGVLVHSQSRLLREEGGIELKCASSIACSAWNAWRNSGGAEGSAPFDERYCFIAWT